MRIRSVLYVAACLAVAAAGFVVPAVAPAEEAAPQRTRVVFPVENFNETSGIRDIVGYRYDPPGCEASTAVVLQHGLSYTKEVWDIPGYSVAVPLARAGYTTVAIDRLGRMAAWLRSRPGTPPCS